MSVKAHGKTGARTTEPGHHNGESVHDVRATPIDESADDAEEDHRAVKPKNTKSASW